MDDKTRDLVTRQIKSEPVGTSVARYVQVLARSGGSLFHALDLANTKDFRTTPQVASAFELQTKAATAPGTSTDSTWAAPLVNAGITADALAILKPLSVVAQLDGRVRTVPFNVKVPADTTALLGDWIAEMGPTPVGALALSTVGPLEATKIGIIAVLTRELLTLTGPSAEQTVRTGVLSALARTIDQKFLLPTLGPTVAGRPASITFGATAVTSTGATAAAIAADLGSMLAALTTSAGAPVWIMRPTTAAKVSAALGTTSGLPATLYGIPTILSANSPAQITLMDTGMVLVADEGKFDTSISESASVQMDSAPMSPADATTVMVPFFQQNLVGIRAARWINWERAGVGSVVYMTVAY